MLKCWRWRSLIRRGARSPCPQRPADANSQGPIDTESDEAGVKCVHFTARAVGGLVSETSQRQGGDGLARRRCGSGLITERKATIGASPELVLWSGLS